MKKIELKRLCIQNFKGCAALELEPMGNSVTITGNNAVGKTTIYDAVTWLLFGKDSGGRVPGIRPNNFQIKPVNESGEVLDHAAQTRVEAVWAVDGEDIILCRTYFEQWTKKRGRSEAVFDGHSSEFFVDELPVKKNEFDSTVEERLFSESMFWTLTSVNFFCEKETEENRRSALFHLIGGVSEEDILQSDDVFEPLEASLKGMSVSKYKQRCQKRRRDLDSSNKSIPARIQENRRTVNRYKDQNFEALRSQREGLVAQAETARQELDRLQSQSGTELLIIKRDGLKAKLEALEERNNSHRNRQKDSERENLLRREYSALDEQHGRLERSLTEAQKEKAWLEDAISRCREDWKRYNDQRKEAIGRSFTPGVCPNCGQPLPPEMAAEQKQKWLDDRTEAIDRYTRSRDSQTSNANRHKERLAIIEAQEERDQRELEELLPRKKELADHIRELSSQIVTDLPDYAKGKTLLLRQINDVEAEMGRIRQSSDAAVTAAKERYSALTVQVRTLDQLLAGEAVLNSALARIEELEKEKRSAAEEMERLDELLDLCDRFTKAKSEYISGKVNSLFQYVSWTLFETQTDGALVDCCKATVNGVPFSTLNDGAKINAGIDVTMVLSGNAGLKVPLFIDSAEAVTDWMVEPDTQCVRMIAAETSHKLNINVH